MASSNKTISEIIDAHKPKNFKFKFIITDRSLFEELEKDDYDITTLDTINDEDLVNAALQVHDSDMLTFERDAIKKAKEPTILDDGIIISKQMATKVDKKLQCINVGNFTYDGRKYVLIKLVYERFYIIEVFILI